MWQSRFGGDPTVVGRTLRTDYRWTYTIIGVMPPGFAFPGNTDIWMPLTYGPTLAPVERQYRYYDAIAKLRPGLTIEQAERETAAIAAQLQTEYPASNAGWTVQLAPLDRSIVGNTRPALLVLLGLASCVLLIACGNVATFGGRAGHIAAARDRGAHGVRRRAASPDPAMDDGGTSPRTARRRRRSRGRLLEQPTPARRRATDIPRLDEVTFGGSVILFVILVTCLVALIVGLAPALRSRDARPLDAMRSRTSSGGSGGARPREWLVGAQVALTFVLTVAAALLLRSFERLHATDPGFRRHDVLSAELRVPGVGSRVV